MYWVNDSIKLLSLGKIQTWFICTLAIWIPSSTLQYLFCSFTAECGLAANLFLSVLWWRGASKLKLICYQLTGEFWIDSTAWDFYSLHRLLRKFKRNLGFLFLGKWKLFIMKLFFDRGIQPSLISSRRSAWPVLNATKAATFWSILGCMKFRFQKEIYVFINVS